MGKGTNYLTMRRKKIAILAKLNDYKGDLSKQWFVYYSYMNPETRKMTRFRVYDGFTSLQTKEAKKAHARKLIIKINRKLRSGWNPFEEKSVLYENHLAYENQPETKRKSNDYSIEYFLNKAFEDRKKQLRKKSFETYISCYRIFLKWLKSKKISDIDIEHFTREHGKEFLNYLTEEKKLSNTSRNKYLTNLKTLFKTLIDNEMITKNPWEKIDKLPEQRQGKLPFKSHQVEILKKHLIEKEPQLWLFCQFQYYCFIRPGELRLLKVGDIDFDNAQIRIRAEISKNKKTQYVVIPQAFYEILIENKIHLLDENYYVFGLEKSPGTETVSRDYFNKLHKSILDDLGISNKHSLYSWKHTGAVKLANSGISLKHIQMQIRHYDLNTLDIYLKSMGVNDNEMLRYKFPAL